MRRKIVVSCLLLDAGLFEATAEEFSVSCSLGDETRTIEIVEPGTVGSKCDVKYTSNTPSETVVPYHANTSAEFCSVKAREMVALQKSQGFKCDDSERVTPCNFERTRLQETTSTINVSGKQYSVPLNTYIKINEKPDSPLVDLIVFTEADLGAIQNDFAGIVRRQGAIPNSNCNNRYDDKGYSLSASQPNATGKFRVTYESWKCVSWDDWCPTFRQPGRTCRREAKTKLWQKTIGVTVGLKPTVDEDGNLSISATSNADNDISGEFAFFGGLLGSLAGIGTPIGAVLGEKFGEDIENQISSAMFDFDASEDDSGSFDERIELSREKAEFFSGQNNRLQLSDTKRLKQPLRPSSACYFRSRLLSE